MGYSQTFQLPPPNGVVAPVVNITSVAQTIEYLGAESWSGYYIDSYKGTATPSINIGSKYIAFTGIGTIWDISIKNGSGTEVIFLPCQEGLGNDNGNRTVFNQYADNYTDHFLLSTTGLWTNVIRQDTYNLGYSIKTDLGEITELVTNGTFDTDVSGWTIDRPLFYTLTNVSNKGRLSTIDTDATTLCWMYQQISGLRKVFRYFSDLEYSNLITNTSGFISINRSNQAHNTIGSGGYVWTKDNVAYSANAFTFYTDVTSIYFNVTGNSGAIGAQIDFDNITLKVYEDGIKIPISLNTTSNDCLGNTKTSTGDLIAKYYFNGNVNDESGNGYDGTVNGATLTTNRFGIASTAYEFDGIDDYIRLDQGGGVKIDNFINEYSFSLWVKVNSSVNASIINAPSTVGPINKGSFNIEYKNNAIEARVSDLLQVVTFATTPIDNNIFTHIVVTRDGTQLILYKNGIYQDSIPHTSQLASNVDMSIGRYYTTGSFFTGTIDDVRIYSKVLSNAEIKALYRQTPTTAV